MSYEDMIKAARLDCALNEDKPTYYQRNKEKCREYAKEYQKKNRAALNEYHKNYMRRKRNGEL